MSSSASSVLCRCVWRPGPGWHPRCRPRPAGEEARAAGRQAVSRSSPAQAGVRGLRAPLREAPLGVWSGEAPGWHSPSLEGSESVLPVEPGMSSEGWLPQARLSSRRSCRRSAGRLACPFPSTPLTSSVEKIKANTMEGARHPMPPPTPRTFPERWASGEGELPGPGACPCVLPGEVRLEHGPQLEGREQSQEVGQPGPQST